MRLSKRRILVLLGAIAALGAGCAVPPSPTLPLPTVVTATPLPTSTPTDLSTPGRQVTVSTVTPTPGKFKSVQITEQSVVGARWSEDGQSVVYATQGERLGTIKEWWQHEVATGERHPIQPPFELDPEIWAQLEASYVDDVFVWFGGGLSPSGARVVYSRLPPGYNHTPAPDDFSLPPYEAWTAQSDGSNAVRLQSCPHIGQAIWLAQERKILLVCSYEGGGGVSIASVDGTPPVDPLEGLTVSHWVALSPDETMLAFPDAFGTLHIASLDDGEIQPVAQWGYMPNWSSDSRRLYYQHAVEFTDGLADVRVYDLDMGTDTLLMPSPLHASGDTVSVPTGWMFVVSPLEDAAVFENGGLWLVRWTP